jgi:sulfite exporter TauE/SafE
MIKILGEAFILGLSTGIFCLGWCSPPLLSFLFSEILSYKKSVRVISEFISGRFIAYLTFGGVIGYLGDKFSVKIINFFTALSIIFLSILLLLNGIFRRFQNHKGCKLFFQFFFPRRFPLISGILMGFNICPPFLIAVSNVISSADIIKGILFFLSFFLATSLYLIPFIFSVNFQKFNSLRWIAQSSAIISGFIFLIIGIARFTSILLNQTKGAL